MKSLIVEDDLASRLILQEMLSNFGPVHTAVNGKEGLQLFKRSIEKNDKYKLICLDIMMPEMDGQQVLKEIREIEASESAEHFRRTKVFMVTALGDVESVMKSFYELCDGYLLKPVTKEKLLKELKKVRLIAG